MAYRTSTTMGIARFVTGHRPNVARLGCRKLSQSASARSKKPELTHLTQDGSAHMVDVSSKTPTKRSATALGRIYFSNPQVLGLINENALKKGDVLGVARVAGIMAVKSTPNIIPLCHPIAITKITNDLDVLDNAVEVRTTVQCEGKTGVEMEALTGALASLATVYDMCKAVDKEMVIGDVRVVKKSGGKTDIDLGRA